MVDWRGIAVAPALGAIALASFGCGGGGEDSTATLAGAPAGTRDRIQDEHPPRPQRPYDVIQRRQEPKPVPAPDPSSIPPASAGTNGSYVPRASASKVITPRSMERLEPGAEGPSAILLGGIALAPPNAPEAIKAAITAANEIVGRPYVWGGGHASWYSSGYDCSGAVSYALGGGGFLAAPLDSSRLESWGEPGPGRWLTVYANPGHAYAVIAGLRWDTVGDARGTGPRWHPAVAYPEGFIARHPPGF